MTTVTEYDAASSNSWLSSPRHVILKVRDRHENAFRSLLNREGVACHDVIQEQLCDLALALFPKASTEGEIGDFIRRELKVDGDSQFSYGVWIFYPWRNSFVHTLPRHRFEVVQSNRNREKITSNEQELLRGKRIGVVGLSVGHCCALTIAQEGLCGELRIADRDTLSVSNLNRLRTSLVNLGVPKSQIAYREISELTPFLDVKVFEEGVTAENLASFCTSGGKLDLLVEECDDLAAKFAVREVARELGIPVMMETNDRGMIDVERFDLEPSRDLFHGLTGDHTSMSVASASQAERMEVLFAIVGGEQSLSERLRQSFGKIGAELVSYPQLASDVHLGGATTAHVARKLLLGEHKASGRYHVDLDHLFEGLTEECLTTK